MRGVGVNGFWVSSVATPSNSGERVCRVNCTSKNPGKTAGNGLSVRLKFALYDHAPSIVGDDPSTRIRYMFLLDLHCVLFSRLGAFQRSTENNWPTGKHTEQPERTAVRDQRFFSVPRSGQRQRNRRQQIRRPRCLPTAPSVALSLSHSLTLYSFRIFFSPPRVVHVCFQIFARAKFVAIVFPRKMRWRANAEAVPARRPQCRRITQTKKKKNRKNIPIPKFDNFFFFFTPR